MGRRFSPKGCFRSLFRSILPAIEQTWSDVSETFPVLMPSCTICHFSSGDRSSSDHRIRQLERELRRTKS